MTVKLDRSETSLGEYYTYGTYCICNEWVYWDYKYCPGCGNKIIWVGELPEEEDD